VFKVDIAQKKILPVNETTLADEGLQEQQHLETILVNSFDAFAQKLGITGLLIGRQIYVADEVLDHLDMLALDASGKTVVIELKRSYDDNQLYQAIGYAAMLSDWTIDDFAQQLSQSAKLSPADARKKLEEFLKGNIGALNRFQRVIIVAEEFDFKTLVTAKWLREKHGVDVTCVQCDFGKSGSDLLLSLLVLIPTPGLAEMARDTRVKAAGEESATWESRIADAKNGEVAAFFKAELNAGQERDSQYLHYRIGEPRRLSLGLRKKHAYVWQYGRFDDDIAWWRGKLGDKLNVESKNGEGALSFGVKTRQDLEKIKQLVGGELIQKQFMDAPIEA